MTPLSEFNQALRHALSLALHEPEEALDVLRRTLVKARAQGNRSAISQLARHAAVASVRTGDLPGALGLYEEALAIDPTDSLLHLAIGGIHREIGQYDEARSAFERGLR